MAGMNIDSSVLVVVVLVVTGAVYLGAYGAANFALGNNPSTISTSQTVTTNNSTTTSTGLQLTGNNVSVTAVLQLTGWNGSSMLVVHLTQGQNVTLNIVDNDTLPGDTHQLFLQGFNVVGPTISPSQPNGTLQFSASEPGTYAIICLNPNCDIHNIMSGTLEFIVS